MADIIQGLSIGLNLDTSGINKSMKELKGQLKTVDSEMKNNMSAFARGEKSVEKYQTQISGLNKKLEASEAAVNGARAEYDKMVALHGEGSRQADIAGAAYNNLSADFNNLQRYVGDLTEEFQEFQREIDVAESGMGRLSAALEDAGSKFSAVGDKMKGVGESFALYVTAPIAAIGGAGVAAALDLESSMAKIRAQTGLTKEATKELADEATDLWKNGFGENIEEAGEAIVTVKNNMIGLNSDELKDAAESAYILRDAFGIELAESTSLADNLMTTFGIESQEAFDMLTTGFQNGLNFGDDFADTLREYGPIFEGMGMDAEGALSFMETAQQAGFRNLDVAADTFKEFSLMASEGSEDFGAAIGGMDDETQKLYEGFQNGKVSGEELFYSIAGGLKTIEDPTERFNTGVALMGTKFEDVGETAIMNMGEMRTEIETTTGSTEAAGDALYDTFGAKMQGIWRELQTALLPVGEMLLNLADKIFPKISSALEIASGWFEGLSEKGKLTTFIFAGIAAAIGPVLVVLGSLVSMFGGVMTALAPLLLKIANAGGILKYLRVAFMALTGPVGLTVAIIAGLVVGFIALYKNSDTFREKIASLIEKVKELATQALAALKPAIAAVVGFFKDQLAVIQKFWSENSETIMAALTNIGSFIAKVFDGIWKVIQFIMPAVLAIIKSVWGNIKGVITGALDIIMGAVKVFSGLFSGDFGKMWEGLKQMFSGAITFLWNFISLTFFGKILGGAKLFIGAFRGVFASMWAGLKAMFSASVNAVKNTTVNIFTSLFNITKSIFTGYFNFVRGIFTSIRTTISTAVSNIFTKVKNTWTSLKSSTSRIFGDIFTGIKNKFDDIVNAAKNLPRRIGDGIGSMATKVKDGVNRVVNNLASTLGKGINGVIGGVNWVLGKIGVESKVPEWAVPKYAHGTKGHPGGLAMVGDGKGSNAGSELIQTPSGELSLSPSTETLINLPKGSQVLSAKKTSELLASLPHYANGVGGFLSKAWEGTKNVAGKAWEGTKKIGGKVKDAAFSVWDHISNPGKLLDTALSLLGIKRPAGGSFVGNMAKGGYNKIKNGAAGFLKKSIDNSGTQAGSGNGFGSAFRLTSRRGFRINPVTGIGQMHQGDDLAAARGTLIPSQAAGKVIAAGYHAIRGNFVKVQSGIMERLYQHNARNMVKVGQTVRKGQAVGTVGSTGRSTGNHLHYEVKRNGVNINPNGLATGGLINSEQLIRAGEGNKAEIMIPLDPARRTDAMKLLALAGRKLMPGNDKGITRPNNLPNVNGGSDDGVLKSLLAATLKQNEILMQLLNKNNDVYLDSGALVGATGEQMNNHLGSASSKSSYFEGLR